MEMTDRRSWSKQQSSSLPQRSLSFSSTSSPEGEGVSDWCNDEILPRSGRMVNTVGTNNVTRLRGVKRFHVILCLLTVLSVGHLMGKGVKMIDEEMGGNVVLKNKTKHENLPNIATTTPPLESPVSPPQSPSSEDIQSNENPAPTPTTSGGDDNGTNSNDEIGNDNNGDADSGDDNSETDDKPSSDAENRTETLSPSIIGEETQNTMNVSIPEGNATDAVLSNETQIDVDTTLSPSSSPTEGKNVDTKLSKNYTAADFSNHLPQPLSDADLSPMALKFAETHCDLTQVKDGAWYPSSPEDSWQQRAPYLIFAGMWNSGVGPLKKAILKHPQISSAKMEGFFLPKQFSKYISVQTNDKSPVASNQTANTFNVKVFAARERMYAQVYSKAIFQEKMDEEGGDVQGSEATNQNVAVDVSPGLVFYAQKTAHSILCTAPWVKVVVLLRNPIDRLYRQWAYSVQNLNLKLSLEDWMAQEMKLLQSVGLIGGGDEDPQNDENYLSEKQAWEKYQSVRKVAGAIGRSLYVFQLEEWIQAYKSAGKDPSKEIMVLTTEDIEENPGDEYLELLKFLGLGPFEDGGSVATSLGNDLNQESGLEPMKSETRTMLKKFFKPYNKRLTELLTSNGFEGNWDKRWKE